MRSNKIHYLLFAITPQQIDKQARVYAIGCLGLLVISLLILIIFFFGKWSPPPQDKHYPTGEEFVLDNIQYKVRNSVLRNRQRCARGGGGCWEEPGARLWVGIDIKNVDNKRRKIAQFKVNSSRPFTVDYFSSGLRTEEVRYVEPGTSVSVGAQFDFYPNEMSGSVCHPTLELESETTQDGKAVIQLEPEVLGDELKKLCRSAY
jgi:type II secretory pathway component PulJ